MSLIYRRENFENAIPEIKPLVQGHWDEVTDHRWPPDVDWERFIALEQQGILRFLAVRDEGTLVGYFIVVIIPCLHYRNKKMAHDDAFYLRREYRKVGAVRMFETMLDLLRSEDVDLFTLHEKLNSPHEKFFTKMGFTAVERIWAFHFEPG